MGYSPENNPYIPGDPYSYDLKWMVDKMKQWTDPLDSAERAKASKEAAAHSAEVADLLAREAANKADDAKNSADAAADYAAHIADPVSGLVTEWLADHITQPTTPAIDTSLSVAGAAADAKAAGDAIRSIVPYSPLNPVFELGSFSGNGNHIASNQNLIAGPIILPIGTKLTFTFPVGYEVVMGEWSNIIPSTNTRLTTLSASGDLTTIAKIVQIVFRKTPADDMTLSDAALLDITSDSLKYYLTTIFPDAAIIKSTNDNTDRSRDILFAVTYFKHIIFEPGNYFIGSNITIPAGRMIEGAGSSTILETDNTLSSVFTIKDDTTIKNITIEGTLNAKPNTYVSTGGNGIAVGQADPSNRIENVNFIGLAGAGYYASSTFSSKHFSTIISNCTAKYCGCAYYIGKRSEATILEGCAAVENYIGVHCIAGNSRINGCIIAENTLGIDMISASLTDNDGHSTFVNCIVIHNTIALHAQDIEYGVIFNGCTFFYGDITINRAIGVIFNGCEIGSIGTIDATSSQGARILNSIFNGMSPSDVINAALINCTLLDGTPFA